MTATAAEIARRWWQALQPDPANGRPGNRGALARLRRANLLEAMSQPETIQLFRACGQSRHEQLPRAALLAGVLAHVREDKGGAASIAQHLGPDDPAKPETALMSPLRFRRLIEAGTDEEELTQFRRMVALMGNTVPVADLAASLLDWGEQRRVRWTYDYWGAGRPFSPASHTDTHSEDDAA